MPLQHIQVNGSYICNKGVKVSLHICGLYQMT